jgi:GNAT superfamily N-acetyltransferase
LLIYNQKPMNLQFKKVTIQHLPQIWAILQKAIARRKADGSNQWQDGYPNPEVVKNDIEKGIGYVLTQNEEIIGYCAVLINDEPAYSGIEGKWLTGGDFVVYHRVAIAEEFIGKGFAKVMINHIHHYATEKGIYSVKADTNFDNNAMLKIFNDLGYSYCGEVYFRGSARKAFEKVLDLQ